jgi:hydroxymethylbilane synthase
VKTLRIAARKSDLARLQAYRVGQAIEAKFKDIKVSYHFRESLGDQNQSDPLWKMPEKGVFTEDFLQDLETGKVDLVVHSWKDLPTEPRVQTEIVATLEREDVRDLVLIRTDRLDDIRKNRSIHILTSSPRRAHNLDGFLKDYLPLQVEQVLFHSVRGNISTRIRKLVEPQSTELLVSDMTTEKGGDKAGVPAIGSGGESAASSLPQRSPFAADGLVVAKAALDRLLSAKDKEFEAPVAVLKRYLYRCEFVIVPVAVNPSAAAQGALAIEIKKDSPFREMISSINHLDVFQDVLREREVLRSHGGGCHQKIGINFLTRSYGSLKTLRGQTDLGVRLDERSLTEASSAPRKSSEKRYTASQLFPDLKNPSPLFARTPLSKDKWIQSQAAEALYVTRESAWPENFQPRTDALIWTAGLKTWRLGPRFVRRLGRD